MNKESLFYEGLKLNIELMHSKAELQYHRPTTDSRSLLKTVFQKIKTTEYYLLETESEIEEKGLSKEYGAYIRTYTNNLLSELNKINKDPQ